MKKNLSIKGTLFFITLATTLGLNAQTVTLKFTGRGSDNSYIRLNKVVITNLTKSWQETIWWPDTVLTMQSGTDIDDYAENSDFALSQNNPNPFTGSTEVSLTVAEEGRIQLEIADMNGRTVVETQKFASLQPGNHQFRISLSTLGTYVMTARQNGKTSSIKMICNGGGGANTIEYLGAVQNITYVLKSSTNKPFNYGDMMEYVGYASFNGTEMESQRITQAQGTSQTFTLQFAVAQLPNAPTGVAATVSGTQIHVSWNPVSNATNYKVYRCSSANGSYTQIGLPTSNNYYDANPLIGYNYYKVKAVNSAGESSYSSYASCNYSGGNICYLLNEGFENSDIPTGWTTIDNDGDGQNWYVLNNSQSSSGNFNVHSGEGHITSASYNGAALTPDNWLITPAIFLSDNAILSFWVAGQDPNYVAENFSVYLSSSGTNVNNFNVTLLQNQTVTATMTEYTVNLSAYTGNTVHIAFRHHNVTDMFRLNLDDIAVYYYCSGTTIPNAPTEVSATLFGSQIYVSWNSVSNATSYKVYRSSSASGSYTLIGSPTSTHYYDNSPLTGYNYYKVKAMNSAGESSFSSYASCNYSGGTTVPNAPTGVTATVSGSQIYVSWNSVSNATSYKVYRSSSASGSYTLIGSPTSTHYYDSSPLTGYNYYKIKAVNSAGESSYSSYASCNYSGGTTVPSAPTGVTATLSGSQIYVSWNSVSNATSYKVYRSSSVSGSYTLIGSPTSTHYYDSSPLTGYNYYKVKAVNSAGESSFSSYASCNYTGGTTVPNAPTGVSVINMGTSSSPQLKISWNSVSNATSYKVYRSSTASGTYSQIGSATSNTYLYDNSPMSGHNYYKVKAVNSAGESSYSSYAHYNNTGGGGTTIPNAPTGVLVTNMGTSSSPQLKISWNSVSNATSYKVFRSSTASGTYSQIGSATSNTYLYDNSPMSGYNYYKVKAVNSAGESSYSSYAYYNNTGGGSGTNAPCPPTVSVSGGTYTQSISWTVNTGSGCGTPTTFQVWQLIPCYNEWLQLTTTTSHYYFNTSVYPGINRYKVVAINSAGSAESTANSPSVPLSLPDSPFWFSCNIISGNCVQFTWDVVDMATGYEIWYSTNGYNYYLDQTIDNGNTTTTTKCYPQFSGNIVDFKIRAFFDCNSGDGPTYSDYSYENTIWF